jgi:hypothetical protein
MKAPVPIAGIGAVSVPGGEGDGARAAFSLRLSAALDALSSRGRRVRLVHSVEEAAFLAAVEAFDDAGMAAPAHCDRTGIALGVDEGIDGIKADHCLAVARDGPTGASPLHFPCTAPNAVAAQLSIALDLRGESVTFCGGPLCGARALGHALHTLREGRAAALLAGGATSVTETFLDGLLHAGVPVVAHPLDAACLFLFAFPETRQGSDKASTPALLGFGEGFGEGGIRDALLACLEDAGVKGSWIGTLRVAASGDDALLVEGARRAGISGPLIRSPNFGAFSAAFPLTLAAALRRLAGAPPAPILVAGTDCWGGAVAAIAR